MPNGQNGVNLELSMKNSGYSIQNFVLIWIVITAEVSTALSMAILVPGSISSTTPTSVHPVGSNAWTEGRNRAFLLSEEWLVMSHQLAPKTQSFNTSTIGKGLEMSGLFSFGGDDTRGTKCIEYGNFKLLAGSGCAFKSLHLPAASTPSALEEVRGRERSDSLGASIVTQGVLRGVLNEDRRISPRNQLLVTGQKLDLPQSDMPFAWTIFRPMQYDAIRISQMIKRREAENENGQDRRE
ncbi:hypothetical protein CPB83DRAFT_837199 [Crepidotus variabilis]|uniref:Uncharacterized protein n=1 Tax=Crepidotus variabilis TaxID=179855 RepID=A0A9P6JN43_9AGAR|nr:hypothetical protein CPB83DRAFT_837199 [Crepidotus variabilis]